MRLRFSKNQWQKTLSSMKERWSRTQRGGPEHKEVVQKSGPETRYAIIQLIADNANITSREMANKLNINRSAILKHLKKLQEENLIAREGSQKSGRWIILRK